MTPCDSNMTPHDLYDTSI